MFEYPDKASFPNVKLSPDKYLCTYNSQLLEGTAKAFEMITGGLNQRILFQCARKVAEENG